MKKKILIIGGAGFIGHNLALSLIKEKYQVKIIDSLSVNNLKSIKKSKFYPNPKLYKLIVKERIRLLEEKKIKLNFINAQKLKDLSSFFRKYRPNTVVHLAAVSHANKSNDDPNLAYENSLTTLKNSLISSVKNKVNHFIFLSSSMVYGNFKKSSVDENTLCNPVGIYGNLKFAAEFLIKSFKQTYNLDYTILRPSALYGERCISRRVGQIFIENALTNKPLIINGSLDDKLDFTHIDDLVLGIKLSIKNKKAKSQIFNITHGQGRKIGTLISILKKNFSSIKVVLKKRDKLVPKRGTLSTKKAKKLLNYKSKYPLEKGYQKYIFWYRNFFNNL
tara:strand:- start:332 stop:1333 length:1002 start_codon:yes stop_codon:yes gene_type:complete